MPTTESLSGNPFQDQSAVPSESVRTKVCAHMEPWIQTFVQRVPGAKYPGASAPTAPSVESLIFAPVLRPFLNFVNRGALSLLGCALVLVACEDECKDAAGVAFLAKAAAEKGAIQTETGLVYKELVAGYGPQPEAGDRVQVHYHGTFIDGKVFDSSVERGRPSTFPLDKVIPGWTEGLKMMKGGGKTRLVIPPHLAYGAAGKPPKVPPCAILVFEVELLGIY